MYALFITKKVHIQRQKEQCLLLIRYSAESSSEKRVFSLTISKVYQINSWRIILLLLLAEFDCSKNQPANANQGNASQLSLCQSLCFSFTFYVISDFLYIHNCLLDTVYCALDFYEILSTCGRIPADKREKECEVL